MTAQLSGRLSAWPSAAPNGTLGCSLMALDLQGNKLIGPLPALDSYVNLQLLNLAYNHLTGV